MSLIAYPTDFAEAATVVVGELRHGSLSSPRAVRAALHLVLYGVGQLYPDDMATVMNLAKSARVPLTCNEAADVLEEACRAKTAGGAVKAIDWKSLLATLLPLLLKFLA